MATSPKNKWLSAALDYIPSWIELQLRASQQPGCVVAIAFKDKVLLDQAFGVADLSTGEKSNPSPSVSCRLALEELHRRRRDETARARQTEAR